VTLLAFSARLALLAAVIVAAAVGLSDLVAHFLHVRSAAAIAIVLCGLALSLLTHCQRGVLQGSGRFGRLALSTIVEALVKVGGAAAILTMSSRSVDGAVAAIPLAAGCTLLANAAMLRFLPRDASARAAGFRRPGSSIATVATFALLALLLSADILAAKRFLPPHAAGLYAAVSLCGKTTFFATSAVSVFLFPLFSAQRERGEPGRRLLGGAAALVIAVSVAMVTIFTFAPGIVLDPLFGARFAAVAPYLGTIAIAFGGYAVSYLTAMFLLARGRRIGVPVLSAVAAVQIGGLILEHGSVAAIVHVQLVTLTLGAVALLAAAVFAGDRS
jgi:O-antigen/teichoic acid export membrane protein